MTFYYYLWISSEPILDSVCYKALQRLHKEKVEKCKVELACSSRVSFFCKKDAKRVIEIFNN